MIWQASPAVLLLMNLGVGSAHLALASRGCWRYVSASGRWPLPSMARLAQTAGETGPLASTVASVTIKPDRPFQKVYQILFDFLQLQGFTLFLKER